VYDNGPCKDIRSRFTFEKRFVAFQEENVKLAAPSPELLQKRFDNIHVMQDLTPIPPIEALIVQSMHD
jgi:hypothetical protein